MLGRSPLRIFMYSSLDLKGTLLPGKHLFVAVREKINGIKAASRLPENEKVTKTEAQWTAFKDLFQEREDQLHTLRAITTTTSH